MAVRLKKCPTIDSLGYLFEFQQFFLMFIRIFKPNAMSRSQSNLNCSVRFAKTFMWLSFTTFWILTSCTQPNTDRTELSSGMTNPDRVLQDQLNKYPDFRKAMTLWMNKDFKSDSLLQYYKNILGYDELTPDQRIYLITQNAFCYYMRREYREANKLYYSALPIIQITSQLTRRQSGIILFNLGYYHQRAYRSDSALLYFKKAQETFDNNPTGRQDYKFTCLLKTGDEFYWRLRDYTNAEKYYKLAYDILDTIKISGKDSLLFEMPYSMTNTYLSKKEYDQAVIYADSAIKYADSKQKAGWMADSRHLLSTIYHEKKDWKKAISYCLKALQINKETDSVEARVFYFETLARIYIDTKKYDSALLYNREAFISANKVFQELLGSVTPKLQLNNHSDFIRISEMIELSKNRNDFGESLANLGTAHKIKATILQQTGHWKSALAEYQEAMRIRKIRYDEYHNEISDIYHFMGKHFQQTNQLDLALQYYQQALISGSSGFRISEYHKSPTLDQIENNISLIEVLKDKATALNLLQQRTRPDTWALEESLICLKLCDSLIDKAWNSYANEDAKLSLEGMVQPIYEQAIETAYQLYRINPSTDYLKAAYYFMEKNRYKLLRGNLVNVMAYQTAKINKDLTVRLRDLDFQISYLNRQKMDLALKVDSAKQLTDNSDQLTEYSNKLSGTQDRIFKVNEEKGRLNDSINKTYPELVAARLFQEPVSLDSLKGKILGNHTILLQYFTSPSGYYLLSTNGVNQFVAMIEKTIELENAIDFLIGSFKTASDNLDDFIRYSTCSFLVFNTLIQPALEMYDTQPTVKIVIVPDGKLNQIAFDALTCSSPANVSVVDYKSLDYLVKHHSISYAFSSSMLAMDKHPGYKHERSRILAFSYGTSKNNIVQVGNLVWSNRELSSIRAFVKGRYFRNEKATEERFKKLSPHFEIIHLALHGQAGMSTNDSTMLFFRRSRAGADDGLLFPEELYKIRLDSKLVILSSCDSGRGKFFDGEGIFSMARAFAYAGCTSLVATLWQIPDKSSSVIMARYYQGLKNHLTPDEALRYSKIGYLENSDNKDSHPLFWASFIPIGKMESLRF